MLVFVIKIFEKQMTEKIFVNANDPVARKVIGAAAARYLSCDVTFVRDGADFALDLPEGVIRIGALIDHARMLLGRARTLPVAEIILGDFRFYPHRNLLSKKADGGDIALTEKESMILNVLAAASGRIVARGALLAQVWGYGAGLETHTLETHIYRLRQKIESDASAPALLLTEEDGYRLAV